MPPATGRISVIYVSYDAAADPLGRSQVVAYLERLAATFSITLVSFEKERPAPQFRTHLESCGIRWRPLPYHKHPPVASTAWDVTAGAIAIDRELRRAPGAILHTRSYVPTEMVLRSPRARRSPLLFDIRGFWVDERVAGGRMGRGMLYRYARARERRFFERANAIVTLTDASTDVIRRWTAPRDVPIQVIPTCADAARFATTQAATGERRLVWMGSVGGLYRLELAAALSGASGLPLTVLTKQIAEARSVASDASTIAFVPPAEMPGALRAGDIGLCLYRPGFWQLACAPTRFAEFLAAGMPVAVTPGLGDLERIVEDNDVGCVVRNEDEASLREAGERLAELAAAADVQARCRAVAAERFDVDEGTALYAELYRRLARA